MLFTAYRAVMNRADYNRTATGRWQGEFRGPFVIRVETSDIESCRDALLAAADARISEWLRGEWHEPAAPAAPGAAE